MHNKTNMILNAKHKYSTPKSDAGKNMQDFRESKPQIISKFYNYKLMERTNKCKSYIKLTENNQ